MRGRPFRLLLLMDAFLLEFWKPIVAALIIALAYVGWRIEEDHIAHLEATNKTLTQQLAAANAKVEEQNAAIKDWQTAGIQQQNRIDALASAGTAQAEKVVTQWKTKLVQVPIPASCDAAIAAGAENAASVARLFQASTRSSPSGS